MAQRQSRAGGGATRGAAVRVLVIAAHPDDETLGCGGALLKHREAGDGVAWLIVTQAHAPHWSPEVVAKKQAEVARVAHVYGMEPCVSLGFPAARLDTVPKEELICRIRDVVDMVKPDWVYVVHGGDVHTDHQAVFTATAAVLKPLHMGRFGVRRILCYETLSSTDASPLAAHAFWPTVFTDIGSYLDRKIDVMAIYETERHADPWPRGPSAIRALARVRGAAIGVEYAEAFHLLREIV